MNILSELTQRGLVSLLDDICTRHHVTRNEICGRARTRMISFARQELWWQMRNHGELHFSYVEIGRIFSRNHSTILQGVRQWQKVVARRRKLAAASLARAAAAPESAPKAA